MKNFSLVALAALSLFAAPSLAQWDDDEDIAPAQPAPVQPARPLPPAQAPAPQTPPQPSEEKYQKYLADARALQAELKTLWLQHRALQAAQTYSLAIQYAPTPLQRAVAFAEGGDVLFNLAAYPGALQAFRTALQEKALPAELKKLALYGIASSEYRVADNAQKLEGNTARLRANYEAAFNAGRYSDNQYQTAYGDLARLWDVEGKHLEAAREYARILEIPGLSIVWDMYGRMATSHLTKLENPQPAQLADALALTDKIFTAYLPVAEKRKERDPEGFIAARMNYAQLLARFGQPSRAEKLYGELAADTAAKPAARANAMVELARVQSAQKKFDAALTSLDGLQTIGDGAFAARRGLARAEVFQAQNQPLKAYGEYALIAFLPTAPADPKVDALWGMADFIARDIAALQAKNAPAEEIEKSEARYRTYLSMALRITDLPVRRRYDTLLKLAARETEQGKHEAARAWLQRGMTSFGGKDDVWFIYNLQRQMAESYRQSNDFAKALESLQQAQSWDDRLKYGSVREDAVALWRDALTAKDFPAARASANALQTSWKSARKSVLPFLVETEIAAGDGAAARTALDEWEKLPLSAAEKATAAAWRGKLPQ